METQANDKAVEKKAVKLARANCAAAHEEEDVLKAASAP